MGIKRRIEKLETVTDWRGLQPPGVSVAEAEAVQSTLARLLADHMITTGTDLMSLPFADVTELGRRLWAEHEAGLLPLDDDDE